MAIFHYPFTKKKLSASCPLLSLIISFINPDQGSPSTLEASTRKVLSEVMNNQVLVLKRKAQARKTVHPTESKNVQTQEEHKQKKSKKKNN